MWLKAGFQISSIREAATSFLLLLFLQRSVLWSTEDQVTYIAQKIEDGFQDKQHARTVCIDMEKVCYKV